MLLIDALSYSLQIKLRIYISEIPYNRPDAEGKNMFFNKFDYI